MLEKVSFERKSKISDKGLGESLTSQDKIRSFSHFLRHKPTKSEKFGHIKAKKI